MILPQGGTVFVSVKDADKDNIVPAVEKMVELGFTIIATGGTAAHLAGEGTAGRAGQQGGAGTAAHRRQAPRRRGALVFNTTEGWQSLKDSHSIRDDRAQEQGALLHDGGGEPGRGAVDRGAARPRA